MSPSTKIVVFDNTGIPVEQFRVFQTRHFEVQQVPQTCPANALEKLLPFHFVFLGAEKESAETLELIRALRKQYTVPLILTATDLSASYVVQAFRSGITDCLLAPYSEEQINDILLRAHLESEDDIFTSSDDAEPPAGNNLDAVVPSTEPQADLLVQFLGAMRLFHKGQALPLPGGYRQRSMLAYLFYHAKTPLHRDRIIRQFWPSHELECAKNNLNVGICKLRKFMGQYVQADLIQFHQDYFRLNPDLNIRRDLDVFQQHILQGEIAEQCGSLDEAAECYSSALQFGPNFLEEFSQEIWSKGPREAYNEKYLRALNFMGEHYLRLQNYEAAIGMYRLVLDKDDCQETAHKQIIRCYLALGKKEKAVRQYQECVRVLREKLDINPSGDLLAME